MDPGLSYPIVNLIGVIIDEVALEGLDGITLEALWQRLNLRLQDSGPLTKSFMEQVWVICLEVQKFTFYQLPQPRPKLVIVDRYEFIDPDIGIVLEPPNLPDDIYPHHPICELATNIKGSCSTYRTREQLSLDNLKSLSFNEIMENYETSLVVVASQSTREFALLGDEVCPTLELTIMQYCFLERVGRSRYHGEVTQGKLSLALLKEDPKSLFYHRKYLLKHKLITKQTHHQKINGHGCSGSLLHLTRFYVERKPKIFFLAEQVIDILKSKENYIAEYDEIKQKLQVENALRKMFKTSFFQKLVKTDLRVPYRVLYPNALEEEYQQKRNPNKEKLIRVLQLLDPNTDITEIWNKEDAQDEEESLEIDIRHHKLYVYYLRQANRCMEARGKEGISQSELGTAMGLTKLQARTLTRNLVRGKIAAMYMSDMGRQRATKFVSKKFEKNSAISQLFNTEMDKMKQFTNMLPPSDALPTVIENPIDVPIVEDEITEQKTMEGFNATNKILQKYRIIDHRTKYKYTFLNLKKVSLIGQQEIAPSNDNDTISHEFSNDEAVSFYNSIKIEFTTQKPVRSGKKINEVFGFIEDLHNKETTNTSSITYRLLKRANMIMEAVKDHLVIDDTTKIMKIINIEEEKEGYDVKMDKKSLQRLLQKLGKDNLVKNIRLTLSTNGFEKHITFICHPNIDIGHDMIKSLVEHAKIKFCLMAGQKVKQVNKNSNQKLNDAKDKTTKHKSSQPIFKYEFSAAKRYGYSPKFIRMKLLHILLYHLIYDHPGEQYNSKSQQLEILRQNSAQIEDDMKDEMSTVFTNEIGWKMFIPPLPEHGGWPRGWALMSDIILRLPLSIFVKIHRISFNIPDLDRYLSHPIRQHYLVIDLPSPIRNTLFFGRKYIYNVYMTAERLCYLGLLQFGPQRLKEKDQVFVYLNKKTELMDTTSSCRNYHKIETKIYPTTKHDFQTLDKVENYWYDMWNICMNTPLGARLAVQGKDIILEDLSKKPEMIESIKARGPEEAELVDTGMVPGDRSGAAGIDSAFFSHFKRNWNWTNSSPARKNRKKGDKSPSGVRDMYFMRMKMESRPLKFTEFVGLKKVTGPTSVNAKDIRFKSNNRTNKVNTSDRKTLNKLTVPQRNKKQTSFVRTVLPRKRIRRRVKYDEIDHRALQRMSKLRVDWDRHEDNILLVCKVAMMYLFPNYRKQMITFTTVRDVLRSYSNTSYNKTSRACQRRLLYMLRHQQTVNSVALGVRELKENFSINKRFGTIVEQLKSHGKTGAELDKNLAQVFNELVGHIVNKYYNMSDIGPKEHINLPKTIQEFNIYFKLIDLNKSLDNKGYNKDIRNVDDIHSAVMNSVIHSSMCCGKDRRSWAYQLFKVYQQYPEVLLRNAMAKIRSDQMVTVKKSYMCAIKKFGNCMPMSSSQYQLSTNYTHTFLMKWPYDVFKECYEFISKLYKWYDDKLLLDNYDNFNYLDGCQITPATGGAVTAVYDFVALNQIDFDIEIPDQVITLDPRLKEKDEPYLRIAKRYQHILENFSLDKTNVQDRKEYPERVIKKECQSKDIIIIDEDEEEEEEDEMDLFTTEEKFVIPLRTMYTSWENRKRSNDDTEDDSTSAAKKIKTDDDRYGDEIESQIEEDREPVGSPSSVRVNRIIKNLPAETKSLIPYFQGDDDRNDPQKRYTRIALLKMKKEIFSSLAMAATHHAHEFFVVNMFNIFHSLRLTNTSIDRMKFQNFDQMKLPGEIIPLDSDTIDQVVEEIKRKATFSQNNISFSDCLKINERLNFNWKHVRSVYKYIREQKELGVTADNLMEKFSYSEQELYKIVEFLTDNNILLRSGVTVMRYIHHRHVDPWLIHSFKMSRLEQECRAPVPQGSVYILNNENNSTVHANQDQVETLIKNISMDCVRDENDSNRNDSDLEEDETVTKRLQRTRTCLLPQRDIYRAAKQLDHTTAEKVQVVMKPWIRIDGVLNRRVLDRMLGAVLTYCLTHPGVYLNKVQSKFIPALQPFHTYELLEILIKIGCLKTSLLKKSHITLFSRTNSKKPEISYGWASPEETIIEPVKGAILKLSIFLSKKLYSADFIE